MTPLFCFACGKRLTRGYPGGDPENGPARFQCPDGHPNVLDYVRMYHAHDVAVEVLHSYLEPSLDPYDPPASPEVRAAAEIMIAEMAK